MHRLTSRSTRKTTLAAVSGVAAVSTVAAVLAAGGNPADASTADASSFAYGASAFGSHVTLGTLANVGKTANTPMCTTHAGTTHTNRTAKVDLGAAGYIGAVTGEVRSRRTGVTKRSSATTHTARTVLAGGAIVLDAVTTSAAVSHNGSGYHRSGSSTFVGLHVAGLPMPSSPKPNTTYTLPGLGSLTLNEQHAGTKYGIPTSRVIALDLVLGSNNSAGLPAGRIVIGQSAASLRRTHRVPSGSAWATQLSVASVLGSGRTAAAYTGCGGTGNAGHSNDVAGIALPNVVATVDVARSYVHTIDSARRTTSSSLNRVAGVSLLGGVIKVKVLTTQANATDVDGHRSSSASGTSLVGLVVQGKAVNAPRMGQQRSIPGLGELSFGSVHRTSKGVAVYGLRLVLGSASNGLPAGAAITVGAARASVGS